MSELKKISISDIIVSKRIREDMGDIDGLAEDIKTEGIITPITVHKMFGGKYLLLAGGRRLQAAQKAGYNHIDAYVRDDMYAQTNNLDLEIAENVHRKPLDRYELVKAGREIEEKLKIEAKKHQRAGKAVDLCQNFGTGRVDDIIAKKLKIGSGEQYRKFKIIVDNKGLLTADEFTAWRTGSASTNKILNLIKERQQSEQDTTDNPPKDATQTIDASKSLKQWKGSFKSVTKSIQSTIESLQNTDVCIYDQYDAKINHELMAELESCLKKTQQLFEKINIMTLDKEGALFLDTSKIR